MSTEAVPTMTINDVRIDPEKLMYKDDLLAFLRENGENDRALSKIRDRQYEAFGEELMWRYPISEGWHLGTFIVLVKEGFLSLPFDFIDKEDYELLELGDAEMIDAATMQSFIDDWRSFSDDLLSAMTDMLHALKS